MPLSISVVVLVGTQIFRQIIESLFHPADGQHAEPRRSIDSRRCEEKFCDKHQISSFITTFIKRVVLSAKKRDPVLGVSFQTFGNHFFADLCSDLCVPPGAGDERRNNKTHHRRNHFCRHNDKPKTQHKHTSLNLLLRSLFKMRTVWNSQREKNKQPSVLRLILSCKRPLLRSLQNLLLRLAVHQS